MSNAWIRHAAMASFLLLVGCKAPWQDPPSTIEQPGTATGMNLPPTQMLEVVKRVVTSPPLSLPIQRQDGGTIYTGYQSFPGEWHILRRWHERTRYRIDVTPDFAEPAQKSNVEVREETETRAASNQKFERAPELRYPERARAVLEKIKAAAAANTPGPAGATSGAATQ